MLRFDLTTTMIDAIDGGESTIYPNMPIDIDNESEVGSEKQFDLDGDG